MSRKNKRNTANNGGGKKMKPIFKILIGFVASIMLVAGIGAFADAFNKKEVNPDNLITKECYYDNLNKEWDKGLKATWRDDGTFYLSGKYSDEDKGDTWSFGYPFASLALEPGQYTFNSGNKNSTEETAYLYIEINGTEYKALEDGTVTFEITEAATALVNFRVRNNVRFVYKNFEPTLVPGDKPADFYVEAK